MNEKPPETNMNQGFKPKNLMTIANFIFSGLWPN